jgi:uncharacterized protein YbjT (DUF2867 family)
LRADLATMSLAGMSRQVFMTGGTGYLGRPLINELIARGHVVRTLVRPGSEWRLPAGAVRVPGNALDASTYASQVPPADTLVHLIGTPRPSPAKAAEFRAVDLVSIRAAIAAGTQAKVDHLIYVSVAHPAPIMRAYVAVRQEGEALIRASGLAATFLRPWYVLGPGHRWPYLLMPLYALLRQLPSTRAGARRLGLVTRPQMIRALVKAVELGPNGIRVIEVEQIRSGNLPA